MNDYSIFQVLGPVMVGPSSSHTAGACRIAKGAREILGPGFTKAEFLLHGSFAKTYRGHGTDLALVAGVLGCSPKDPRISTAFDWAKEEGLDYAFIETDLGDVHPNTVKIRLTYPTGEIHTVTGSSIGGGNIRIVGIDDTPMSFENQYPTLIFNYQEQKGVIAQVSKTLFDAGYNIEAMTTKKKGNHVTLMVELTESLDDETKKALLGLSRFSSARYLDVIA